MNRPSRLVAFLLLVSMICFFPLTSGYADSENDTDKKDIDIGLSPQDLLFDINNMKPGDWVPRTLTVKNLGSKDFDYQMTLRNSGDKKLFNELLLEIKADGKELYQGKLAAFKSLPARNLTNGSEESLAITIRFPEELGNDFQGLQSSFVLSFIAEGKNSLAVQATTNGQIDSGNTPSAGHSLPTTATNIFNLVLVGSVLVAGGIVMMIMRHFRRIKPAQPTLK